MKFIVDPRIRYNYATWYIYGMTKVWGKHAVVYDVTPFISIHYDDFMQYVSGMPVLMIADDGKQQNVFIDYGDYETIFSDRYEWADSYLKVNVTEQQLQKFNKVRAIGPGFGIQLENPFAALWKGLQNYLKSRKYTSIPMWRMMADYAYSFVRRCDIKQYQPNFRYEVRKDYVFHASTLWVKPYMDRTTNAARGAFLNICKALGMKVDGGLFFISKNSYEEMPEYPKYLEKYKSWIVTSRFSPRKYIDGTKASLCVFNTPSVGMCHGWKLAEYLCMGKAIISTPLTRVMPGEGLEHGKNVHFVKSPKELREAIVKLRDDDAYRYNIERNARDYYERYLKPEAIALCLVSRSEKLSCLAIKKNSNNENGFCRN